MNFTSTYINFLFVNYSLGTILTNKKIKSKFNDLQLTYTIPIMND